MLWQWLFFLDYFCRGPMSEFLFVRRVLHRWIVLKIRSVTCFLYFPSILHLALCFRCCFFYVYGPRLDDIKLVWDCTDRSRLVTPCIFVGQARNVQRVVGLLLTLFSKCLQRDFIILFHYYRLEALCDPRFCQRWREASIQQALLVDYLSYCSTLDSDLADRRQGAIFCEQSLRGDDCGECMPKKTFKLKWFILMGVFYFLRNWKHL